MAESLDSVYQAVLGDIRVSNYLDVAAAGILLYDHIITIDQEVELVWKRRWSAVNFLFVANRVLGDLNGLGLLVEASNLSKLSSCTGIGIATIVPESLQYINWALFSALRVYAVGGQQWLTTSVVFLLSITPLVTNVYFDATSTFMEVPFTDTLSICSGSSSAPPNVGTILSYVTRAALVAADIIVIIVTFWNTFGIKRDGDAVNMKTELSTMLIKDGSLYFAGMVILNVAAMVTDGATDLNIDLVSVVSAVSTVIVARFLLNLRQVANRSPGAANTNTGLSIEMPHMSEMHFGSRVVGHMGAELEGAFGLGVVGKFDWEGQEVEDESLSSPGSADTDLEMQERAVEVVEPETPRECDESIAW